MFLDSLFCKRKLALNWSFFLQDDTICASSLDEYGLSWSNTYGGEIKYGSCPTDKTGDFIIYLIFFLGGGVTFIKL